MGTDIFGQLGLGTGFVGMTNLPVKIVASGVTAVAAGRYHSLFIKSDGSLWGMGYNGQGQLGAGDHGSSRVPEEILSSGVTAIAAGGYHSLFIKSDGSLWGMGDDAEGDLGDGIQTARRPAPEQIMASNVTAIAAGETDSLFLKSDGSLWAMGDNVMASWATAPTLQRDQPSRADRGQQGHGDCRRIPAQPVSQERRQPVGHGLQQLRPVGRRHITHQRHQPPEQIVASNVTAIAGGYIPQPVSEERRQSVGHGRRQLWPVGRRHFIMHQPARADGDQQCHGGGRRRTHSLFIKSDGSLWAMG